MVRRAQVTHVRKRTGDIIPFKDEKIQIAIEKAMKAVDFSESQRAKEAEKLTEQVIERINARTSEFERNIPNIEQIQDIVEESLIASPYERVAKAYMLYRKSRQEARALKQFFNIRDDLKFGVNAIKVLEERYLLKDSEGKIIETPTQLFSRVSHAIASIEERYGKSKQEIAKLEHEFFELMKNPRFLNHFHFSIQSFSDRVLKLMNRNYDAALLDRVLTRIRNIERPDKDLISIGADIIT